jgi:transcriptional regulator with XRE-family HTH domain
MDVVRLGRRIAARREQLGLKQLELARRAGMSEASINRLENGVVRNPKINDLTLVARALSVSMEALLGGEPAETDEEVVSILARQPRLVIALASLVRGLQWAEPEDREFVLGHLESLVGRFGDKPVRWRSINAGHSDGE